MLIDLNTEELRSAVQIARQTNAQLTDVANLLNSVVIHHDWQCPERDGINANTSRNRQESMTLQADAERLYNNIIYASEQFSAMEQEIARSFETVDGPLASFLSQTPVLDSGHTGTPVSGGGQLSDLLGGAGGAAELAKNWKPGTDVVDFGGLADVFKGR